MSSETGKPFYVVQVALVAALGGLLFGYDTAVISGAVGFLQEYFELSPKMVGWAASSALVGCIVGAAAAGTISDRIGRKKALLISAVLFFISAVGSGIAQNLTAFICYRILGGLAVGAASMVSPMYIAEISPARMRGRMVSVNQLAIVSGMLVVYFVNMLIEKHGTGIASDWNLNYGWRWMFGSEAVPAILLFVLMFVVPESPRWLMKQGRDDEAREILADVDGATHANSEAATIKESLAHEGGSVSELFRPKIFMLLLIGITLAVLQQVTGINVVLYYAPEIFKDLGSTMNAALLNTVAVGAVNLLFTVVAIYTVDRIGRKPLLIIGAIGMGIALTVLGTGFYLEKTGSWALVFVLLYIASFALSLGPVVWVVLSEIFPTKIRGRAMGVATVALWCACYLVSQTFPMMNDNPALVEKFHHGFPFWVYAVFCLVTVVFVAIFVPETKGKSLEEIEEMWMK